MNFYGGGGGGGGCFFPKRGKAPLLGGGGGGSLSQRIRAKLLLVASQYPCSCKNLRTVQRIFKVRATETFTEICRLMQFGLYRDGKGGGMSHTVW